MAEESRPDWQVRIIEYAENMRAVKGDAYTDKLLLWVRVLLQLAIHAPTSRADESKSLLMDLARGMELDDKDVMAVGEHAARSRIEALRGRPPRS